MRLWLGNEPLVLASASEVRRGILAAAGIPLETVPAAIDERGIVSRSGLRAAGEIAALLAREKAFAIATRIPDRLVLGADQTLALGSQVFSKPEDVAGAREQLGRLRGKTHALHAAIALARGGSLLFQERVIARLTMRNFSDEFLQSYLAAAGSTVTASVGAYQLEKLGIHLFEKIGGDHFAILGLPLLRLLDFLRREGFLAA
jgi:nucleoside triphosphate pyrophosphatase